MEYTYCPDGPGGFEVIRESAKVIHMVDTEVGPMNTPARTPEAPSTIEQVRAQLWEIVEDGLRHGFFEFAGSCEIVKDKKRRLVIRAGKGHQYTIPQHELPAS